MGDEVPEEAPAEPEPEFSTHDAADGEAPTAEGEVAADEATGGDGTEEGAAAEGEAADGKVAAEGSKDAVDDGDEAQAASKIAASFRGKKARDRLKSSNAGEESDAEADDTLPDEYEEEEEEEPEDLGDEEDEFEGGEGYGDFDMLEAAEVDADEEQVEEEKANLAELFKQAQEEKATFLDLNQALQRKLSDHLHTIKKADDSKDVEKSVTDQEQRYYKCLSQVMLTSTQQMLMLAAAMRSPPFRPLLYPPQRPVPLAQVNELRDELKRIQLAHDKSAVEMKRRLDDKQTKAEEIKQARAAVFLLSVAERGATSAPAAALPELITSTRTAHGQHGVPSRRRLWSSSARSSRALRTPAPQSQSHPS